MILSFAGRLAQTVAEPFIPKPIDPDEIRQIRESLGRLVEILGPLSAPLKEEEKS